MKVFLKQYFFFLQGKKTRAKFSLLLLFFLLSSFMDIISIGLIGVFLAIIASPVAMQKYVGYIPFYSWLHSLEHPNAPIFYVGGLIILLFSFKAFAVCFIQTRMISFSSEQTLKLKVQLIKAFQSAHYTYYLNRNTALLIDYMQKIDGYSSGVLMNSLTLISGAVMGCLIALFLLLTHPMPTLILMCLFTGVFFLNNIVMKNKVKTSGEIAATARGIINRNILHALKGIKEIRILGREAFFLQNIQQKNEDYTRVLKVQALHQALPRNVIEAMLATFIMLLCMGSLFIGMNAAEVIAFTGVFVVSGARLIPVVSQLTAGINQLVFNNKTMECLYKEFKQLDVLNQSATQLKNTEKLVFDHVSLQDITYRYPEAKKVSLDKVNFHFKKGQSIGIIGTSGAGKSTLVDLLLGFLTPETGQVLIDERPLVNAKEWLNNFAYIPQHIFLLDDTLKHNIALGVQAEEIDMPRMHYALEMAQLNQVVDDLPDGLETVLGENGIRLSGGQRQRVALARTLYYDKDIIVMDEATSALDNETEHEIINAMRRLQGLKTIILIAHRLTTLEHCDVLFKMENGRIIQSGTFEEVVGSTYRQKHPDMIEAL